MPISAARKAAIRAEILEHAARLFRLRGHAGTNIDDIMLAAGLTRGAFYAHFTSKDDLFAEIVRMGHGLLPKLRAGNPAAALDAYLDRDDLAANALACTLASLAGDIARAPLPARLAYANVLHGAIAELAKGRQRRGLDADATVAAILAVGAVVMARASGDPRLSDWLLRCARRTVKPLMKKPAKKRPKPKRRVSRVKKRSPSHRKAAAARPSRRAARSRGGRA
jgi:TetR/AcrR family transcriptional regulator, transcriptional repressor for nem operon